MPTKVASLGEFDMVNMSFVPSLLDTTDCVLKSDSVDYRKPVSTRSRYYARRYQSRSVRVSENMMPYLSELCLLHHELDRSRRGTYIIRVNKYNKDGTIQKYNAHLVALAYYGIWCECV